MNACFLSLKHAISSTVACVVCAITNDSREHQSQGVQQKDRARQIGMWYKTIPNWGPGHSEPGIRSREAICAFPRANAILACTQATAREYGQVKAALRKKGHPIPEDDVWIAALARQHNLKLIRPSKPSMNVASRDGDRYYFVGIVLVGCVGTASLMAYALDPPSA